MHEMSVAASILDIAREELKKHGLSTLTCVRICHGPLSNIVPDSLHFCFEALTVDTPFAGARLELEQTPLLLRCGACGAEFSPERADLFAPCPECGGVFHAVEKGRELYVQTIEAE